MLILMKKIWNLKHLDLTSLNGSEMFELFYSTEKRQVKSNGIGTLIIGYKPLALNKQTT